MKALRLSIIFSVILSVAVLFMFIPLSTNEPIEVNNESGSEYNAGLSLYKQGKYLQAIPHFQKAYQLDDKNIAALFAQGLTFNKLRKYNEAAEKFKMVLDKNPTHPKALKMYPTSLASAGKIKEALDAYDQSITALPQDYYVLLGKARVFIQIKKYKEALKLLEKAIKLDPKRPELYETMAFVYRKQEKFDDALLEYEKALKLKPGAIRYLYLRAQTFADMGRMKDAGKAAMEVLKKNPAHAHARLIVADYMRLSDRPDEALEEYAKASKNIETKAYAEYYIEVIKQKLEEIEIEKEYETRQKKR